VVEVGGPWPSLAPSEGEGREPRSVVLDALRGAVSRPAAWGAVLLAQVLLAAIPALMAHDWLARAMGSNYAPGSLLVDLDALFRHDHKDSLATLDAQVGVVGAALALASVLLGCFVAGGWLQVFLERTEGETLRRFAFGGARWFWRFARVAFVGLLLAALCTWLVRGPAWNHVVLSGMCGVPASDWSALETLDSELSAWRLRFAQDLVHALAIALVLAWGDWTRTRMALLDTNSAAWAGLCTLWTLLRHPLRTLGASAALFGVEAALLLLLGLLARSMESTIHRTGEAWPSFVMLALVLASLALRVVLRGARYHAAVGVSRQVVTPILRPDPWKDAVGGPGGPRYPIGDDEHRVQF
jgi:hypothetical protein